MNVNGIVATIARSLHLRLLSAIIVAVPFLLRAAAGQLPPRDESKEYSPTWEQIEQGIVELRRAGFHEQANRLETSIDRTLQHLKRQVYLELNRQMDARQTAVERRCQTVERLLVRLRQAGGDTLADDLETQIRDIQQDVARGRCDLTISDEPELHLVRVARGVPLPDELRSEKAKYRFAFAEIQVTYPARPVVLALSSSEPILWKIDLAEGSLIHAIVVDAPEYQIVGVPEALVLSQTGSLRQTTGRVAVTQLVEDVYSGTPIVVGPENPQWLGQYAVPKVQEVLDAAQAELKRLAARELGDLRFRGVTRLADDTENEPSPFFTRCASEGEFTLDGPIESTLRPLPELSTPLRQWVTHAAFDPKVYAISAANQLVYIDPTEVPPQRDAHVVDMPLELRRQAGLLAVAFDNKRRRLLVSAKLQSIGAIYAYDLNVNEWMKLIALDKPLSALAYLPEQDQLLGIRTPDYLHPDRHTCLLRYGATGRFISEQEIEGFPEQITWRTGELQLVRDMSGRMVLLTPPRATFLATETERPTDDLYVIDAEKPSVVYSAPLFGGQFEDRPEVPTRSQHYAANGSGTLALIDQQFAQVEREVAQIKAQGRREAAGRFQSRLDGFKQILRGRVPARQEERLYSVGYYEGLPATVHVTDKSGPIVLALSSYHRVPWTIETEEGVQLTKILVGGNDEPEVVHSPKGIPIEFFSDGTQPPGFCVYQRQGKNNENGLRALKALTRLEPTVVLGDRTSQGKDIVVGVEDSEWRTQLIAEGLSQLTTEMNVDPLAYSRPLLQTVDFWAVYPGQLPGRNASPASLCRFSLRGPMIGSTMPVPAIHGGLAYDPLKRTLYDSHDGSTFAFNLETGERKEIAWDDQFRESGRGSSIAFDTKRQRLLLNSPSGRGYLFACDVASGSWSILRQPALPCVAMTYAEDDDMIYAVNGGFGSGNISSIYRCNPQGAVIDRVRLDRTLRMGVRSPDERGLQLTYFDGHLAILRDPGGRQRAPRPRVPAEPLLNGRIAVVDMSDAKVAYEGELVPYTERRELTHQELTNMWTRLAHEADPVENVLWEMAAGHERTITFLEDKLLAPIKPVDVDLAPLVKQLDSDRFADRREAFLELQSLGSAIAPQLETIIESKASPEVVKRLQSLLDDWRNGQPDVPAERQLVRGVEVLDRIGSTAALDVLRRVAETGQLSVKSRAELLLKEASAP